MLREYDLCFDKKANKPCILITKWTWSVIYEIGGEPVHVHANDIIEYEDYGSVLSDYSMIAEDDMTPIKHFDIGLDKFNELKKTNESYVYDVENRIFVDCSNNFSHLPALLWLWAMKLDINGEDRLDEKISLYRCMRLGDISYLPIEDIEMLDEYTNSLIIVGSSYWTTNHVRNNIREAKEK